MSTQAQIQTAIEDEEFERDVLDAIDRWVEREVRPIAREYDQADKYPEELVEQMKELGLFGATISREYGGLGLNAVTYANLVSRVCEVWMAPSGERHGSLRGSLATESGSGVIGP